MALFQHSVLNKYLSGIDEQKVDEVWETFVAHFHNSEVQKNIRGAKEKEYQDDKLSNKLQRWYELTFKQFLKELKKKKVELTLDKEAQ